MWAPFVASMECLEYINSAIEELEKAKYQAELSHQDNDKIDKINKTLKILK